uniref:Ubiquitin-like domain-containing protein n=1 Tax=Anopheles christyi TaxID=43041 RepID=A0A182KE12_9DIPT
MDVTLIVKASNQQCEDLTIKCEPSWTIRRLKGHLTEVYPGKPSTDEQKLIYSGQLLGDSVVLKDVLRQYDGQQAHTVHLVFTPKNSYYGGSSSSSGSKSNASNTKMASNSASSTAAPIGTSGSNNSISSTSASSSTSSYGHISREGVHNVDETIGDGAHGDGLRHRPVLQTNSTPRVNPRPSQFVEQTAALQAYMQTYMQCLNQYVNLINEQANANAVHPVPGTTGNTGMLPPTVNPLSGAQPPFPNVPFVPMVQPTMIPGAFPNLAYYPCMATAPYASGFPASSNIPTAASSAGNGSGVLPNNFLASSGMPSPSGQPTPVAQIPGSSNTVGEAGDASTAPGPSGGEAVATATPAEQSAQQDVAPAAAAAAPARARRFPNIVVEEQENNDWLDVFFSMCRVGILITVIYLYSSPIRCLTVLFIGVMLYLKKHLDRVYQVIDRRIPRLQPAQEAAPPREQEPAVVAQPNNNVPEQNPEQLPSEHNAGGTAGTESATKRETSEAGPSSSSHTAGSSGSSNSSNDPSTNGRANLPRPRTGPLSQNAEAANNTVEEEQQEAQTASDEIGAAEQPAAEGQRMTFNDMTSFLGTLVITFFTSIIPDTPAA